jgi:hypothetical protein
MGEDSNVTIENIYDNVYPSTRIIGVDATLMIQATATMPRFNIYMTSSAIGVPYIQGEYTNILLGVDQHATSIVKQLCFDGVPNNENI